MNRNYGRNRKPGRGKGRQGQSGYGYQRKLPVNVASQIKFVLRAIDMIPAEKIRGREAVVVERARQIASGQLVGRLTEADLGRLKGILRNLRKTA